MLTHIGVLTLVPTATEAHRRAITDALSALVGRIDGLLSLRFATDLGLREGNADLTFQLTFASQEAWAAYNDHPAHKAVIAEHILPVLQAKTFVQTAGFTDVGA